MRTHAHMHRYTYRSAPCPLALPSGGLVLFTHVSVRFEARCGAGIPAQVAGSASLAGERLGGGLKFIWAHLPTAPSWQPRALSLAGAVGTAGRAGHADPQAWGRSGGHPCLQVRSGAGTRVWSTACRACAAWTELRCPAAAQSGGSGVQQMVPGSHSLLCCARQVQPGCWFHLHRGRGHWTWQLACVLICLCQEFLNMQRWRWGVAKLSFPRVPPASRKSVELSHCVTFTCRSAVEMI